MNRNFYKSYLPPTVDVAEVSVEAGFAYSQNLEDPVVDETSDWK